MINIKGLDKADVLVELYNNSHQQGLVVLQETRVLTHDEAEKLVKETGYFDYLYGKILKLDLSSDEEFSEFLYDRDNGEGAAQYAVNSVRNKGDKSNKAPEHVRVYVKK